MKGRVNIRIKIDTEILYRKKYISLMFSGLVFAVPFLFPQLYIISFFAAVPVFYIFFKEITEYGEAVKAAKLKSFIKYTIVFAMPFYLAVYIWFLWFYPLDFAGLSKFESALVTACAWFGFPILQTLVLLIFPASLFALKKTGAAKPFLLPFISASLYIIAEWVQSWFLTGLTWAKLSISQYQNLPAVQSVSVFGTYFTSFVIIFINAGTALFLLNKKYKRVGEYKNNMLILFVILVYFLNSYFGLIRMIFYSYPEGTVTVQVVQGNISSVEKWEDTGVAHSIEKYSSLTESGIKDYAENRADESDKSVESIENKNKKIDVCVWSETAVPTQIYYQSRIYNIISAIATQNDTAIITGAFFNDYENNARYNSIMAFLPYPDDDKFIQPYNKRHLVPFGEYLPLEGILTSVFPFVENMTMFDATLNWGEGDNLIDIDGVKYGGLVCFDSIFPELARSSVNAGANILIVVTNDSWYKDSIGIYQHNAQSVLRAVENNRYVIRSANTGISSFISPTGEILARTQVDTDAVIINDVGSIEGSRTIYTICGDIILYIAAAFILYILHCQIYKRVAGRGIRDASDFHMRLNKK